MFTFGSSDAVSFPTPSFSFPDTPSSKLPYLSGQPLALNPLKFEVDEWKSARTLKGDPKPFCVLDDANETCDVTLEVEGKQLHACRAVLAHYSPYFHRMFYSDVKGTEQKVIPLPGKQHRDMATFFNVMFPAKVSQPGLITDENLLQTLELADEYEVEQVKAVCQDYIGAHLGSYFRKFYEFWSTTSDGVVPSDTTSSKPTGQCGRQVCYAGGPGFTKQLPLGRDSIMAPEAPERQALIDKYLLYLHACHHNGLPRYMEDLKMMLVVLCKNTDHTLKSYRYGAMPPLAKVHLLEALCRKFDENRK